MLRKIATYATIVLVTLVFAELFHPLAALQSMAQSGCRTFAETGKTVCGKFLVYWDTHGGLAQQGFPLSNEFQEKSDLDGKTYTVQYFERAVFELHPENAGTQYEVLLSQLGTFQFRRKYPNGDPSPAVTPVIPVATPKPGDFEVPKPSIRIKGAYVIVSGVVIYKGTGAVVNPEITVTLVDKDGKDITSLPCCALSTLAAPGQPIPFRVAQFVPEGLMKTVRVEAKASPATQADIEFYRPDWTISDIKLVLPTDPRDFPKLTGTLTNKGTKQTESLNVVGVIYDKDDNILGVSNQVYTPANKAKGATLPFELVFDLSAPAEIGAQARHYDYFVQGDITPGK